MSKAATLGIIFTLLIVSFMAAGSIHGFLEGRVKPPAGSTPETSVYPISMYKPSTQTSAEVHAAEDVPGEPAGFWVYRWIYNTPARMKDVLAYYQIVYKDAKLDTSKPGVTQLDIHPASASAGETARITVTDGSPTLIEVVSHVAHPDTVPGSTLIGVVLSVVLVAILFLVNGQVGKLAGVYKEVAGGTRYDVLESPSSDAGAKAAWMEPQRALEGAGFTHAFDYRISSVPYPNFVRLLHRRKTTYAALTYARVQKEGHHWIEMATHCTDGTSVLTTTSRFAAGATRPYDYPLHAVSEQTRVPELLDIHHKDVLLHEAANHIVTPVAPDGVLKLWQSIEKKIEERGPVTAPPPPPPRVVAVEDTEEPPPAPAPVPTVAPRALPQAPVNVDSPEKREAFCNEVMTRIRGAYPDLTVVRKEGLIITTSKKSIVGSVDLDLTPLYTQFKEKPEGVIGTYVKSLSSRF